jgi:hypothetical protein
MGALDMPKASMSDRPRPKRAGVLSARTVFVLGIAVIVVSVAAGALLNGLNITGPFHPRAPAGGSQAALPETNPNPAGAVFLNERVATDARFQPYYAAHQGATLLGQAVTPAVPVSSGWLQFFTGGALFEPDRSLHAAPRHGAAELETLAEQNRLDALVASGTRDPATGIIQLPLLRALLVAGSRVPIGGAGSSLTYVDLRRASQPDRRVPAPTWYQPGAAGGAEGTFIVEETRSGRAMGHVIPPAFWSAMTQPALAPNGWAVDFGNPLTEALAATVSGAAGQQTVTVELFERGALVQATQPGASGTATPQRVAVGLDYLQTYGPPSVRISSGTPAWVTTSTAIALLANAGDAAHPQAHVGTSFPLALTANAAWVGGTLWYQAQWQTSHRQGSGWLPASAVSFTQPNGIATASFDALDPALAGYLAGQGRHVGAVVYDVTRGIRYEYNPTGGFIVASSIKVEIMVALLTKLEAQGRRPNGNEMYLLTTMIENSNNDSAQALYEEIGDSAGMGAFMRSIGVGGLKPKPGAWGWSTMTPLTMVQVLTLLHDGKVLTPQDRALALNLMRHIEPDQQTGVGDTAPAGATVAMKDGWVPGPDGLWAVNSSGIVTLGGETYIIAVYTGDDDSLEEGWEITRHVSGAVGKLLT